MIQNISQGSEPVESKPSEEKSFDNFIPNEEDIFVSRTSINTFNEEPALFSEQQDNFFVEREEEEKEEVIETSINKPNFIDKILGISRARKNRKEQYVPQEPSTPHLMNREPEEVSFSNDDDMDNLDIPSFLRRK